MSAASASRSARAVIVGMRSGRTGGAMAAGAGDDRRGRVLRVGGDRRRARRRQLVGQPPELQLGEQLPQALLVGVDPVQLLQRLGQRNVLAQAHQLARHAHRLARLVDRGARLPGTPPVAAAASSASSVPNLLISSDAVLGPMPATPGTLSMLSPISASTSPICAGPTPNFSFTSAGPMRRFFIVSSTATPPSSVHSCVRSLSDEQMTTSIPAARATRVSVAMMSSASNPDTSSCAMPNASITRRTIPSCSPSSGGMGGRCAL
jgi:hypothetical protein